MLRGVLFVLAMCAWLRFAPSAFGSPVERLLHRSRHAQVSGRVAPVVVDPIQRQLGVIPSGEIGNNPLAEEFAIMKLGGYGNATCPVISVRIAADLVAPPHDSTVPIPEAHAHFSVWHSMHEVSAWPGLFSGAEFTLRSPSGNNGTPRPDTFPSAVTSAQPVSALRRRRLKESPVIYLRPRENLCRIHATPLRVMVTKSTEIYL